MRNLLAFLGAAGLTVVGVGWYLGWYQVSSAPAEPGRKSFNVEFDTVKIGEDLHKGGQKVQQLLEKKTKEPRAGQPEGGQEPAERPAPEVTGRDGVPPAGPGSDWSLPPPPSPIP